MSWRGATQADAGLVTPATAAAMPDASPDLANLQATADTLEAPAATPWVTVTVKPGQTLSSIFDAQGLPTMDWVSIVRLGGDAQKLKRLKAGDQLHLRKGPEGLQELT